MIEFLRSMPEILSAITVIITTLAAIVVVIAGVIKTFRDGDRNALEKTVEAATSIRGKLEALRESGAFNTIETGITEGLKLIEEHRGKKLPPKLVRKARNRLETILRDAGMEK